MELIEMTSDRVVGIRIDGKIQKADIETVEQAFAEKFDRYDKASIYVEVVSLGGITLDALLEDLKFAREKFRRFEKKAVVSEHQWLGKLTAIGDRLFPSLEVQHFAMADKETAIAWVSQTNSVT
ncbi:MAG: STAS/SEC14 domain-containing protein [Leptolyngbyaceae cyanobacterium]